MSGQYCTFWVADRLFGVPISGVQEVLLAQPVTPVPLAPPEVAGLINLRGQVVTVLDLGTRLRLAQARPDGAARGSRRDRRQGRTSGIHVIVTTDDAPVSLLADRVGEIIAPGEGLLEPPPETLDSRIRALVTHVCKLDEQLMLVLDIDHTTAVGGAA